MRLSRRDEAGVTLVELLVAIVLLSIIIVPLGTALWLFFRNSDDTTRRLSESHDVQISAAYFAEDVQSLGTRDWSAYPYQLRQSVEVNVAAAGGLYPCGAAGTPVAVLRLAWDNPTSAGATPEVTRVSYVVMTVGGERQLHRILCNGSATPSSDIVVVHNVETVSAPICTTSCTAAPAIPQSVKLGLTIKAPGSTAPAIPITLVGQRRQS